MDGQAGVPRQDKKPMRPCPEGPQCRQLLGVLGGLVVQMRGPESDLSGYYFESTLVRTSTPEGRPMMT